MKNLVPDATYFLLEGNQGQELPWGRDHKGSTGMERQSLAHPSIPVRTGAVQGTRAAPALVIMHFLGMG